MLISRFSGLILSLQYPTTFLANLNCSMYKLGGGGGLLPIKPKTTANFKFGTGFLFFCFFFFGFSILANFDWFNGFLLSGSCWLK